MNLLLKRRLTSIKVKSNNYLHLQRLERDAKVGIVSIRLALLLNLRILKLIFPLVILLFPLL